LQKPFGAAPQFRRVASGCGSERRNGRVKIRVDLKEFDQPRLLQCAHHVRLRAEQVNFGHRLLHIPDTFVRRYERLLQGGVWAQADIEFRAEEEVSESSC